MVEVTQADIDALDVIWKHSLNYGSRHEMEQVVAAHRLAAITEGRRQMREEAALVAEYYPSPLNDLPMAMAIKGVVMAISAIPIGDE